MEIYRLKALIFIFLYCNLIFLSGVSYAGIITSGSLKEIPPPVSVYKSVFESNTQVSIFVEQGDVVLDSAVNVDAKRTGIYNPGDSDPGVIPQKAVISSYFIHGDSIGTNKVTLTGSVTFDENVVGIIFSNANLDSSDWIGASGTAYPSGDNRKGMDTEGGSTDQIILSEDRRSIEFRMLLWDGFDQIRVITTPERPTPDKILNVPSYDQGELNNYEEDNKLYKCINDCLPTAGTMVLGYFDSYGWPRMVPWGSALFELNPDGVKFLCNDVVSVDMGYKCNQTLSLWSHEIGDAIILSASKRDPTADFTYVTISQLTEENGDIFFEAIKNSIDQEWPIILANTIEPQFYHLNIENIVMKKRFEDGIPIPANLDDPGHAMVITGYRHHGNDDRYLYLNFGAKDISKIWFDFNEIISVMPKYFYGVSIIPGKKVINYPLPWIPLLLLDDVPSEKTLRVPARYPTIQAAIDAATNGDTVLIADGTYTGMGNKNLTLKDKNITVRSENGPKNCIIDCQGEGRGFYLMPISYPLTSPITNPIISGLTITNCNITDGAGGGIYSHYAIYPTIKNCIISKNNASNGGGIFLTSLFSEITNCLIVDNTASNFGGGIYAYGATPLTVDITNCTITRNTAYAGGGAYVPSRKISIKNSILWANSPEEIYEDAYPPDRPSVTFSDIQNGYSGEGNINVDPHFLGSGSYYLTIGSPCIDIGTPTGAPNTDIEGISRPQGNGYDMGAYEFH